MITSVPDGGRRIRQAHLAGPSRRLDPRTHAVRPDLADIGLAGIVVAPRFADGVVMHAVVAAAMLRTAPEDNATAVSAVLFGEKFTVFDVAHGWAWGQCDHDSYVGWVRASAIKPGMVSPTHRVTAPTAAIFARPDIKTRVVGSLPLNARLAASAAGADFVAAGGGFVHRRHVSELGNPIAESLDPVTIALGFIGTPYVWGGRTRDGIDCSGLTQAVLIAHGIACPRDSDQQRDAFAPVDPANRRRGDLVVFPGHVGILADPLTLVHANAYWMAAVVEPLADVVARIEPVGYRRSMVDAR
ncbi:C40 family peptidase [Polymorphobacter sp. PAMC 29334]|uniref:C40 family peptidase n=1 Tax=Polymorphobacter sp. PAMC 29334 TaxID=2862331 RepID=UPI001C66AAE8|nr:NlpC/P60 family protein [Polymorphobacter sp. PAMC 29334]QYE34791.1 C40 family peptidase [Polymorphobacter sp. PAMC 29334]